MKTLIKNGLIQELIEGSPKFVRKDILIENDRIKKVTESIVETVDRTIDAADCIVHPGLVNAHIHSHDNFNKAGFDNLPLELWMVYVRPFYSGINYSHEEIYIRTLLGCIEMLKTGTTTVIDDVLLNSITDEKGLDVIMKAYNDSGMRAVVTPHTKNIPMHQTIPYLDELFDDKMKNSLKGKIPSEGEIGDFLESQIRKYGKENRVSLGMSISAPQRCTIKLMEKMRDLSQKYDIATVSHVLETKVQERTGQIFYGKSLVEYLEDNELLYKNLSLIHTVWANEKDIDLISERESRTIHNPGSNLKMGSGIAPIKRMLEKGIPMSLGTDNISANDSMNMYEMMKLAGLISKVEGYQMEGWLDEKDAIRMATMNGAKSAMMEESIGSIEEGKKADLVILDTMNERMISAFDYNKAMVYAENGKSVKLVMVDGQIVVEDDGIKTFDERDIYREMKAIMKNVRKERSLAYEEGLEVYKLIEKSYLSCNEQ